MPDTANSSANVNVSAPEPRARWKDHLLRAFKLLGVSSVMSAIVFWNTICKPLRLCQPPFRQKVLAALQQSVGQSEAIRALLPDVRRKRDNAAVAFTLLGSHLRDSRARDASISCDAARSGAFPGDLQALVSVLVVAARGADSTLRLDSLNLSGVSLRGERLLRPDFRGACLIASSADSAVIYGGRFDGADLRRASMRGARLDSSNLQEARLDSAFFNEAVLTFVDMSNATARGTTFFSASMPCVLLGNAQLAGANFSLARLPWAYLGGAELSTVENLLRASNVTKATLDGVLGLPDSVARIFRERGAVLGTSSDLEFISARSTQFLPDSVCRLIAATSLRDRQAQ